MRTPRARERRTAGALALAAVLIQIPFLERGISFYDEGSILAIADALRNGELLYRDRVTTLGPLTFELLGVLFRLFGPSFLVARLLQVIVFALCTVLVHQILRDFVPGRWAWIGAASFLGLKALAFPFWTELNYAQVGMLLCLVSVWTVLRFLPSHSLPWLVGAGVGIGLTVLAKQNLGAFLGLSVGMTLALDSRLHHGRRLPLLLRHGAVLFCGTLLPIIGASLFYWVNGTFGDLIERAFVGALSMSRGYAIPFPGLGPSALSPGDLATFAYTYFPAPIVHLFWEGRLNLEQLPIVVLIASAVKAIYYLPLVGLLLGLAVAWRCYRSGFSRAESSRWALLVTLAMTMYLSLYRADWVHLMSVFPPVSLVCVAALGHWARVTRWATRAAVGLALFWLAAGASVGAAAFAIYRTPIDTARGRIVAPPKEAEYATHVLEYLDAQEEDARILLMRGRPLFYFLTGRRVPVRFDLVTPRLVAPGDDEGLVTNLRRVDQVIYDPSVIPTLREPLTAYAPRSAAFLATRFRVVDIIHPTAVVLKPAPPVANQDLEVMDLWESFDELDYVLRIGNRTASGAPDPRRSVRRKSWMMYRVITSPTYQSLVWTCFGLLHSVGPDEAIVTTPMFHPSEWSATLDRSKTVVTFEVRMEAGSKGTTVLYSEAQPVAIPGGPIRVPLRSIQGEIGELQFCTTIASSPPLKGRGVSAAWAELRIVRESDE